MSEALKTTPPPQLEGLLSRLLTTGTGVSGAIMLAGLALFVVKGAGRADLSHFAGEPAGLTGPGAILKGLLVWSPRAVMQLGAVLLILTPVLRVAFSCLIFLFQKDRLYTLLSLLVLGGLVIGLAGLIDAI